MKDIFYFCQCCQKDKTEIFRSPLFNLNHIIDILLAISSVAHDHVVPSGRIELIKKLCLPSCSLLQISGLGVFAVLCGAAHCITGQKVPIGPFVQKSDQ